MLLSEGFVSTSNVFRIRSIEINIFRNINCCCAAFGLRKKYETAQTLLAQFWLLVCCFINKKQIKSSVNTKLTNLLTNERTN